MNVQQTVNQAVTTILDAVRQHVQCNWTPDKQEVDVDVPAGGAYVQEQVKLALKDQGLAVTLLPGDYRSKDEWRISGEMLRFVDAKSVAGEVESLMATMYRQIKDAVLEKYAAGLERITIPNPRSGRVSTTVVTLAKLYFQRNFGVRFEDTPSGHGGSQLLIFVVFTGDNYKQFLV